MLPLLIALRKTFKNRAMNISRIIPSICKTKAKLQQLFAGGKPMKLLKDSFHVRIKRFNLQINEEEKKQLTVFRKDNSINE